MKFVNSETFPELESVSWKEGRIQEDLWKLFSTNNRDRRLGEYKGHIKGRDYREERTYRHSNTMQVQGYSLFFIFIFIEQVSFMFLTRAWSEALKEFLNNYYKNYEHKIDVLVINSAVWDVTR